MKPFNKEFLEFLNNGTCVFRVTEEIKKVLNQFGYIELKEEDNWDINHNKYYVIRNDASIIAFNIPSKPQNKFNIVCTHSDTPSLLLKQNPEHFENNYLKFNVMPYGGLLNYGFMDRPLSLSGRIILKKNNLLNKKIIDLEEPVAIIPSIAIHQNDKANSNLDINTAVDLRPIISLNKDFKLANLLKKHLNDSILYDHELYLYNSDKSKIINNEFISSPRIDNLSCTYAALKAFINNFGNAINVLGVFNSEEIGSNTVDGADSNFLIDILKRIANCLNMDISTSLANSFIINADNAHARHPNHDELSDYTNTPTLNDGVLLVREINGTSTSLTSAIFKYILEKNKIPFKYYTSRNDFATGSTQAGASLRHLSINSLDIGLSMLAMHSSLELIGIKDTYYLYQALSAFYETTFCIKNNKIDFN